MVINTANNEKQNADDADPLDNGTLIIADLLNPFKSAMEHPRHQRSNRF